MSFVIKEDKIWIHKAKDDFRLWLHWGRTCWSYEGYLLKNAKHTGIGIDAGGDENDFTFSLGIKGLFNFYIGVEYFFPQKWMTKLFGYDTRHTGITLVEEYLWIDFHRDEDGITDAWRGLHWSFDWKDFLFGKIKYTSEKIGTFYDDVVMPEGNYHSEINVSEDTWTRKRFVKPVTHKSYTVIPLIPIPEPGKGENSWDLEDDATIETTLSANSLKDALHQVAERIKKTRRNRAGENWVPDKGFDITKEPTESFNPDPYALMGSIGVAPDKLQAFIDSTNKIKDYEKKWAHEDKDIK